jgi:hypothetical protein
MFLLTGNLTGEATDTACWIEQKPERHILDPHKWKGSSQRITLEL